MCCAKLKPRTDREGRQIARRYGRHSGNYKPTINLYQMSLIPFNQLPDEARLWVFNTEHPLADDAAKQLNEALAGFVTSWAAHGEDLSAGYELRHNQFVLVGVDESKTAPSGCSIDTLIKALGAFGDQLGVDLINSPEIAYRDGDAVHTVTHKQFGKLAESGVVDADTIVFDKTTPRVGDLRHGRWERPAQESWHGRAFDLKQRAGSVG